MEVIEMKNEKFSNKQNKDQIVDRKDQNLSGKTNPVTGDQRGKKNYNSRNNNNSSKSGKRDNSGSKVPRSSNEVNWYIANEQLAKDVASIPFNVLTGRRLDLYHSKFRGKESDTHDFAAPGVFRINVAPSIGYSDSATSTINVAARSIYTWVRHQNSGHTNYEAPDLALYILAMSEIYAAYAEARRVYGLAMTYKTVNRYIPDILLQSLGYNSTNIADNLAQFRAGLNKVAAKLGSLCVPRNFTTFNRYDLLFSNVFLDSTTDRGQYYVFKRSGYRVFDPTSETGGSLIYHDRESATGITYHSILEELDEMIDAVLMDEDMNIMSGDILKAYGNESLFSVMGVDENYSVSPVFNADILHQIENAVCFAGISLQKDASPAGYSPQLLTFEESSLNIAQINGYLVFKPYLSIEDGLMPRETYDAIVSQWPDRFILNSRSDTPDYKEVLECSRLMASYEVGIVQGPNDFAIKVYAASEIVTSMTLCTTYYIRATGTQNVTRERVNQFESLLATVDDKSKDITISSKSDSIFIDSFDWHPFLYRLILVDNGIINNSEVIGDFHTYATIDGITVANLHECALLGMFKTKLLS